MARLSLFITIIVLSYFGQLFGQRPCTTTEVSYRTTSSTGYYSEPYSEGYNCGIFGWSWSRCTRTRYRSRTQAVYRRTAVYRTVCCSGYSGSNCQAVCAPACRNGGTCSSPNTCSCQSGWSGSQCTLPVCVSSCRNGGTCSSPNTCSCRSGWSGSQCTLPVCRPLCVNGRCTGPNTCTCHRGWTGATCSQPVCSPSCKNGGTCSSPNTCTCTEGWNGESCTNDINECAVENGGCHHTCHNTPGSFECQCNSGYSLASDGRTCNEPPGVPRNITVSNMGQRSATVSWTPPHNSFPNSLTAVSSYHITASQNQFQDQGNRVATTGDQSRMYKFTNLEESTTYSLRVAASNSFGEGVASDAIEATTLEAAPSAPPLAVQASSNSSYNITLQWSPPPEIDRNGLILHYKVDITETETGTEFQWISSELGTALGSLHPFFHYECRVAAHTAAGSGPFSAVVTTQTLPTAPTAAPTQMRVSDVDSTSISLLWEPPPFNDQNGDIVRYHLRVTEQETQTELQYSSTTERYTLTALHPYYNYVISTAAETVSIGPFSSGLLQQTMQSVPSSAPGNFSVAIVNFTSVSLSWSELPPPDRNGVIVSYTVCLTSVQSGKSTNYSAATAPFTVVDLHPDFTYNVRVAAVTVVGSGPFSSLLKARLPEAAPSGPPVHFSIEELLSRSITLKWEYPLEDDRNGIISGFRVHLIESVSGTYTAIDVENTTVTIGDVKPYTLYYAEVAAFTMVGRGPYTERVSVFTLEDVPSPVNVTVMEAVLGRPTQLTLWWNPPAEPNGELLTYSVYCTKSTAQPLCPCDSINSGLNSTSCPCIDSLGQNLSDCHQQAVLPAVGVSHTEIIGGFSPYTNYTCVMTASTSAGESTPGTSQSAITDESTPADEPQDMIANSLNTTAIQIQWSPPLTPNGIIILYTVYIDDISTLNISDSDRNSVVVGGFSPYQLLTVRLSASTKVGEGPLTKLQSVVTDESVPGAVENLQVVVLNGDGFHVSWNPPLSPNGVLTGYLVVVTNLINSQEVHQDMVAANITALNFTSGIRPYVRYSVSVSASTSVGTGNSVGEILYTQEGVPQRSPLNVVVTRSSATSVSIEWDEIGVGDLRGWLVGYEVGYERLRSGGQCPASDWAGNETLSVDTEMLVVTGLDPGLQYCVWVAGRTSPGVGSGSYSLIPWYENTVFTVTLERKNCSEWIAEGLDQIVDDLARGISTGIDLNCRCTFPNGYITDLQLKCNDQGLVFHGRIISTNTSTSTDLLAALEKWISRVQTVTVKGEELPILKSSNEPPESGNAEHINQEDTPTNSFPVVVTAAPVGGVVLLLVVIIVVAIGTVAVRRRQQRKKSSVDVTSTTGNSVSRTPSGEYDRYSNYTYITAAGETHDGHQKDHSSEDEKKGKEVEYEIPAVGDENVYEDPDVLMASTMEGPGICNPTYNTVPVAGDAEGSVEDEVIYSEIKE